MKLSVVPRRLGAAPTSSSGEVATPLGEALAEELLLARHLDDRLGRQGVDDADADAVQAARGRIGLPFELAARMEGGEDHLQRRLARIFGVRVDRDAAAVVADGQPVARLQHDLDPAGMPRDRLVHRIVDDLGGEMVERPRIGPADIHAGAAADGLQPLQHLDGGSVIIVGRGGGTGSEKIGHLTNAIGAASARCQAAIGPQEAGKEPRRDAPPELRRIALVRLGGYCLGDLDLVAEDAHSLKLCVDQILAGQRLEVGGGDRADQLVARADALEPVGL